VIFRVVGAISRRQTGRPSQIGSLSIHARGTSWHTRCMAACEEEAMVTLRRTLALSAVMVLLSTAAAWGQTQDGTAPARAGTNDRTALEFSPLSPLVRIYAVQFARRVGEKNELLFGGAFAHIKYDDGQSNAPSLIVGYRRYLWRGFHIEYQLWPSYNWYYEKNEQAYYKGAELWNEVRPGYTFDFRWGGQPLFLNAQFLIGYGLYGYDSKPESWKRQVDREGELFMAPMFFLGWRF
jgi:hypothetical protein